MDHTLKAVDGDLDDLSAEVVQMGELAVSQTTAALHAFVHHDLGQALAVVAADERLDEMEARIERRAIRFIALRQPMADDLRRPIVAMKSAMQLERCGDLAKNVAKRVGRLDGRPAAAQAQALDELGALVAGRLSAVVGAYRDGAANAAFEVWSRDTEVDEKHEAVVGGIIGAMTADPASVGVCTHLLFIAKNLERIGDHATNIAEMVHYQLTGQDLSHRPKL